MARPPRRNKESKNKEAPTQQNTNVILSLAEQITVVEVGNVNERRRECKNFCGKDDNVTAKWKTEICGLNDHRVHVIYKEGVRKAMLITRTYTNRKTPLKSGGVEIVMLCRDNETLQTLQREDVKHAIQFPRDQMWKTCFEILKRQISDSALAVTEVILWSTEKNVPSYKKQGFEQTNETKTSGPGCILTKMILNVQL